MAEPQTRPRVAILIPCFNEEVAIGDVVREFRAAVPEATIHVYDNGSTDETAAAARAAGATVALEPLRGKGNVVRRMFADVDADIYVMSDGDGTYDASRTGFAISCVWDEGYDMVIGVRKSDDGGETAYRRGHRFGNRLFTGLVAAIFGARTEDMLSGYRVLSRRFVKSFPALSRGFETETELTVHALELRLPIRDIDVAYRARPEGSSSKLNTLRDGWRILMAIVLLVKEERPFQFFSGLAALLVLCALILGIPVVTEFLATGLVPRFPTAILAASLVILGVVLFTAGVIMETVSGARREAKRLAYLQYPAPGSAKRAQMHGRVTSDRDAQGGGRT